MNTAVVQLPLFDATRLTRHVTQADVPLLHPHSTECAPRTSALTAPTPSTSTLGGLGVLAVQSPAQPPSRQERHTAASPAEISLAVQKADFVASVHSLSISKRLPIQRACIFVASDPTRFPDLVRAGKRGGSLLCGSAAYANYRSWLAKLGAVEISRAPNAANWQALLPAYRGARPYERPGDPRFWTAIACVYEHENRLSLQAAYDFVSREYRAAATDQSDPSNPSNAPSYDQVRHHYAHHVDRKSVYVARFGAEAFRNDVAGFITRKAPRVDEIWVGDHHQFDAAVRVWDQDNGVWRPVRPWLTAWFDWGSCAFVGVVIRVCSPNRDSIEAALRSALERNDRRPPSHFLVDNGKDYKAAGLLRPIPSPRHATPDTPSPSPRHATPDTLFPSTLSDPDQSRLRSIAGALGIRVHFALPYNARAKPVERAFSVVCGRFSKLWQSYRGSTPADRPESADIAWDNPEKLPALDQFAAAFDRWLAIDYHSTPRKAGRLAGLSPFSLRAGASDRRPAIEPLSLYKAFLRELPRDRTIQRGGVVRALGREYRSETLWNLLSNVDRVRVRIDTQDLSRVWVYTLDGREIGPASSKPILPALCDSPETVEQLREEQRRHAGQLKSAKLASAARRDLDRWRSPVAPFSDFSAPSRELSPSNPSNPSNKSDPSDSPSLRALTADLDATLRESSRSALDSLRPDASDTDDLDLLASIEAEQNAALAPAWAAT